MNRVPAISGTGSHSRRSIIRANTIAATQSSAPSRNSKKPATYGTTPLGLMAAFRKKGVCVGLHRLLYHSKDGARAIRDADRMHLPTPPPDEPWTLRARWSFPADAAAIPDGRVTIRNGLIESVQATGAADLDLGNVAI